jgi:predicted RNase H-like HicB family nuclease
MIVEYLNAAMARASIARLPEGGYYGTIPGFKLLHGTGEDKAECKADLRESLEVWLLRRIHEQADLPQVGELQLDF